MAKGWAVNLAMTWRDGKKKRRKIVRIFVTFIKFLNAYLDIKLSVWRPSLSLIGWLASLAVSLNDALRCILTVWIYRETFKNCLVRRKETICFSQSNFNWVSEVIRDWLVFTLLCYVIGLGNSRHFLNQSDSPLKPIASFACSYFKFSLAPRHISFAMIGCCDC